MEKITHCPEEGKLKFDDDFDDDLDEFNWPDYEDVPNLGMPTFDDEEDSDFGLDNYVDDCEDDWYEPIPDDYEDDWYEPIPDDYEDDWYMDA